MALVRWEAETAATPIDPLVLDRLAGHLLVLDGATADHDDRLDWVARAPCVVVGAAPAAADASSAPDVALGDDETAVLDELVERVHANPDAARALVEVLRRTASLDVPGGLVLESFAYATLLAGPEHRRWLGAQPARSPRTFASEPVRLERDGSRLRITLARPENRNAFSAAMRDALFEALALAEVDDSIERIVLTGAGPGFSSGGDLAEFGSTPSPVVAHQVRTQRAVGGQIHRLGARVGIEVHGDCVGAGVELPAFGAHVVADPGTTFRLPEISMGLIPGAGGTVSLTRRIGRQRTARLCLLGSVTSADDALAMGLVDEVREVDPPR
jgi:enoyl-CoA hydratase/carnithine racemase